MMKIADYIEEVIEKNSSNYDYPLYGVSNEKYFIPSIANTIGTNMKSYKIVRKNQFCFGPVTSRNGDKISIALLNDEACLVSSSYVVFKIKNENELLPAYLMLWFKRQEFDRYARFMSHGSVRESFDFNDMCNVDLPIPSIDEQQRIVNNFEIIESKISKIKKQNAELEDYLESIFNHYFNNEIESRETLKLSELLIKTIDNRGKTPSLISDGNILLEGMHIYDGSSFPSTLEYKKEKHISDKVYNSFRSGNPECLDILCATVGSLPKICLMDDSKSSIAQNLVAFRADKTKVSPYYLYGYMRTEKFLNDFKGQIMYAVQPSIKVPHILNFDIPFFGVDETSEYDSICEKIYSTIMSNNKILGKLVRIRENLSPIIFGKLMEV